MKKISSLLAVMLISNTAFALTPYEKAMQRVEREHKIPKQKADDLIENTRTVLNSQDCDKIIAHSFTFDQFYWESGAPEDVFTTPFKKHKMAVSEAAFKCGLKNF